MLTVEQAAEWVTHAVQLPPEVADAFRSNSISAYDFPELIEDSGAGLYDLGIKRTFRKRIVKVSESGGKRRRGFVGDADVTPRPLSCVDGVEAARDCVSKPVKSIPPES